MSVISIRPSSVTLKSLGNTRSPDRMPNLLPAHKVNADRSIVPNAAGDLAQAIQRGGGRILSDALAYMSAMRKRDEDRALAAAGAEYQKLLQDGFLGGDNPLLARNADALEGEGLKQTESDMKQLFTSSFDRVCESKGITGDLKERFRLHIAPVDLSWNGRMASHVMAERKRNDIAAAEALVGEDEKTWAGDRFNPGVTRKLLDDYDHKLKVKGFAEEVRRADLRKYALGLAADMARASLADIGSEAAFDEKIRLMKEDPDGIYADNEELAATLGKGALPKETVDLLVTEAKLKKEQFVRERIRAVDDEVDSLIAEGDLDAMDTRLDAMKDDARLLDEGGRVRAATLKAADRLDKAADSLAQYRLMDRLANGEKLTDEKGRPIYSDSKTRMGRLFPKVYAAWTDRQTKEFNRRFRAERDQNLLAADAKMMECAAKNSPQGFYEYLTQCVVNKKITPGDFTRLRDKFNNGWMKGFSGMPGQMAAQSAMAADMLDAIKRKLGVDLTTAIRTDDYGDPVVKDGALAWDDKAELPDASVGREFVKIVRHGDLFMGQGTRTATRKETIEGQQLRKALDEALKLWSANGMQLKIDPVTGEPLPDGKTHTVDAVADFNALLDRLADEKNILSAAKTLEQQAAYSTNVRSHADTEMWRRTERMTRSKPVTDRQIEEKDDKGE